MQIIKKDGTLEQYDKQKIINACNKAARRAMVELSNSDYQIICNAVWNKLVENDLEDTEIYEMHNIVEAVLEEYYPVVAKMYKEYRNYKKDFVHMMDKVYERSQAIRYIGDKSNANTDSALVATKRSLIYNELNGELYKKFFLTLNEKQAMKDGYIYIHDRSARLDSFNCCLFRVGKIMQGGFEMGNVWYNEPNSLDTAFDVMGDIILSTAAQQYGGFTVPEVDKTLALYAEKSYWKYRKEYAEVCGYIEKDNETEIANTSSAEEWVMKKVQRDFEQGWQGIEYKLNTVGSSRGDYPFVTMTIGLATNRFGKMAAITLLNVHKEGQGKKGFKRPVLFPKIVFLYDKNLHGDGSDQYPSADVFNAGISCSSKTMYPDWVSLTGNGYVPEMYKKYGRVVSPMGCVDGKEIITYRYNGQLYVESFERMWNRLSDFFEPHQQIKGQPHLYMDLKNVEIYDTESGFVNTQKIIRNVSNDWVDLHLSNGRRLLCTSDHPITTQSNKTKQAKELHSGEKVLINSSQYAEENIVFNNDKAWLLGFLLCDGCYQSNHIFASIAAEGEDDIELKFHSVFRKYFDLDTKTVLQERGKKGVYKDLIAIADDKNNLQRTINYLTEKFGGINKVNRHIPNEVFSWNYESKLAFLAGMIDADGYINDNSHGGSVVQIGSTNKELALQQMALAQALGMPAKIYHNHYTKKNPNAIRYRIEFYPIEELLNYIVCDKKSDHYEEMLSNHYNTNAEVIEVLPVETTMYSYDVTTDSEHFEVSGIYSHNCRAFLSPWYERGGMRPADENDKPIFEGRCNLGVVSLHLPMILAKARQESKDFYEVLEYYLELIRGLHKRTYDYIGELRASVNPVAFCEGGLYGGNLKPEDKIKSILPPMTMSYGITALNELQRLYNGESIREDGEFALEVMQYIQQYIDRIKEEDQILYAIYGTPAESLCGLQIEQFRKVYGIIENVSDKPYVSNSFHCHVSEQMSPIEKQDKEERFWGYFNGGKIQYCRYNLGYNIEAIKTLVLRAMEKGFYEGVNLAMCYCEDCGYQQVEMDVCPKCGSSKITKIDRMNGYLGFTRIHGQSRYNEAKQIEISQRISM
mgnify:FL=1